MYCIHIRGAARKPAAGSHQTKYIAPNIHTSSPYIHSFPNNTYTCIHKDCCWPDKHYCRSPLDVSTTLLPPRCDACIQNNWHVIIAKAARFYGMPTYIGNPNADLVWNRLNITHGGWYMHSTVVCLLTVYLGYSYSRSGQTHTKQNFAESWKHNNFERALTFWDSAFPIQKHFARERFKHTTKVWV